MNNKVFLGVVFAAALGVGGFVSGAFDGLRGTPVAGQTDIGPTLGAANAQSADVEVDTSTVQEMFLGDENAPITVVEYASYTCPHCRSFHEGAFKDIKRDYIDTGKVKFVYREVYFDRFGLWGSIVARCGDGSQFFGISDLLYQGQSEWTQGSPADIAANLRKIGLTAGLTNEDLDACFSDGVKAQTLVTWFEENAARDNIRSTPSFMINGNLHSNMSYDAFKTILDAQ